MPSTFQRDLKKLSRHLVQIHRPSGMPTVFGFVVGSSDELVLLHSFNSEVFCLDGTGHLWSFSDDAGWTATKGYGRGLAIGTDSGGGNEVWLQAADGAIWRYNDSVSRSSRIPGESSIAGLGTVRHDLAATYASSRTGFAAFTPPGPDATLCTLINLFIHKAAKAKSGRS